MRWATSVETESVCEPRNAAAGDAGGDAVEQAHRSPALPEQQRPGVGGDRAAVACSRDSTALTASNGERDGLTLCRHQSSFCVAAMLLGNKH